MTQMYPLNDWTRTGSNRKAVVRQATTADLPRIVAIHQEAFSHFFLTRLGKEFLRRYYDLVLSYETGIVLVSEGPHQLDGFACGFVDPAEFYREMWRAKRSFVLPALSAMLRHPSLAAGVLYGVHRIQESASRAAARSCELSSIAVVPEAAGSKRGQALMRAFLEQAWSMNAQCVYLTTDADGNDSANAFYKKSGLRHTRRFLQRKGRWMNEYVIERAAAENEGGTIL
jgi:ribosomal protein S18 acetylase RimI-like enzyme